MYQLFILTSHFCPSDYRSVNLVCFTNFITFESPLDDIPCRGLLHIYNILEIFDFLLDLCLVNFKFFIIDNLYIFTNHTIVNTNLIFLESKKSQVCCCKLVYVLCIHGEIRSHSMFDYCIYYLQGMLFEFLKCFHYIIDPWNFSLQIFYIQGTFVHCLSDVFHFQL